MKKSSQGVIVERGGGLYGTEEKNTKRFLHFFGSREDNPRRRGPLNCRSRPTLPFPIGRCTYCTAYERKESKGKKKKNTSFPSSLHFQGQKKASSVQHARILRTVLPSKFLNLFSCSCGKWGKGEGRHFARHCCLHTISLLLLSSSSLFCKEDLSSSHFLPPSGIGKGGWFE